MNSYAAQPEGLVGQSVLTDMPGALLAAGKSGVYGLNGETDWRILTTKYANGAPRPDRLLAYLRDNDVRMIHLSNRDDPMLTLLEMEEGAPDFLEVDGFNSPHRVVRIVWP